MSREITIEFGGSIAEEVNLEFSENFGWSEAIALSGPVTNLTFTEPFGWYDQKREDAGVVIEQQWIDQRQSSMEEDDSLFTFESGELVTVNEETNIASHFIGTQLGAGSPSSWSSYEFTGKMKRLDSLGGMGVTFHSQYPGTNAYYRLRMFEPQGFTYQFDNYFHLTGGNGATWDAGAVRGTTLNPTPGLWYSFRVVVTDLGVSGVRVRANVWENDSGSETEPSGFMIDATDTAGAYTSGTVGAWAMASGEKRWKEFSVDESGSAETLPMVQPITLHVASSDGFLDGSEGATTQLSAWLEGGGIVGQQDVTSDVTWSSSSTSHLTIDPLTGVATSADPGTSSTVTVTATYLTLTETVNVLVTSASVGTGSYQSSVTIGDVTWFFDNSYLVEEILGGRRIVRPELSGGVPAPNLEVVVTAVTPSPTSNRHGSMIDPPMDEGYIQSYDSRCDYSSWTPSRGVTFPVALKPNQSLCSSRSLADSEYPLGGGTAITSVSGDGDRQPRLKDFAVLHCMPRLEEGGVTVDTNTLRPTYMSNSTLGTWSKPVHNFSSLDIGALPSFSHQGGAFGFQGGDANPYRRYAKIVERDWNVHGQAFLGRQLHAKRNMPGYWEDVGDALGPAMILGFLTDPTTVPNGSGGFCDAADRVELLKGLVQVGHDFYYSGEVIGNSYGAPYPAAPGAGNGTYEVDSSYYEDLAYIFAFLFNLSAPSYSHRRPTSQIRYNDQISSVSMSSLPICSGGQTSGCNPDTNHVTASIGVSPSPEAQQMIGEGSTFQPVDPSGLPNLTQGLVAYSWIGEAARSNRNPTKMVLWRQKSDGHVKTMSEHLNPREWFAADILGGALSGGAYESYRRSTMSVMGAGCLCGQAIMGKAAWEALRGAPAYIDYVERWMFKEAAVHAQNEAYVIAVMNQGTGYNLGGETPPGQLSDGFSTNMFLAFYQNDY